MAKTSQIDRVVAEMTDEKRIVDSCIQRLSVANQEAGVLVEYSDMLGFTIARLTGNGSEAALKLKATRKRRTATEPGL